MSFSTTVIEKNKIGFSISNSPEFPVLSNSDVQGMTSLLRGCLVSASVASQGVPVLISSLERSWVIKLHEL